ncbi:uncharacterized protein LOC113519182 isoform X1 [Galleria mellonella]|uniref:Uncharacterized protein LOC113519182 isoform X1 n=1 Tax=Galleria mellonella TaxID=7137 RepID=A0A6J3C295_GALME|nr:uncharacterized protein LOC113519182 isoform X1 [Galleria mellonella]XP_031767767.2 uncharacterized protein LOC113519182 isoform X1 [Galleria mellonella]XP_031767768.2 uncharacterized protein LOC113519182 isoform X1 [Galleria mellonella]XP_031767771.2 uncharacterized protein LOC113519182 isoform X1 [Galleria mellonella]XP_031767774.2 uncharacterized protein LOC113519182 isoform X1 [Galleria mellonella]XP_031767775.2 uncharacterized protein LOC113519182 isoform X1 [Galleria mellonella]XP_03
MWWYCKKTTMISLLITGWLSVQSVDAFGISSFGKANTDPPKPATTTPPPARICSRQPDCAGISSSSCVRTHYDSVTRCLCGDNSSPVNGQCEAQSKTLYHVCTGSEECNDGLICASPNITSASPPHYRVYTPQDKICLCDKENGFVEREHTCSDADILKTSLFAIIVVTCLRKIVAY